MYKLSQSDKQKRVSVGREYHTDYALQFALSLFFTIDAAAFSRSNRNASNYHVTFVDWIPLICAVLGMLVINSIDKSRLSADSFGYSGDSGVAWKARLVLFLGFALLAGGLAGSVTVLVLKYVVNSVGWPTLWFGVAGVCAAGGVMARYVWTEYCEGCDTDL